MMYFGTRERMRWVKAPAPGAGFASSSFSDRIDYLTGGVGLRSSVNAHLEYDFSWGSMTRDEIAEIEDYAYKLYGDDLIYPIDTYAMDRNLFNVAWAAPKITAEDGVSLIPGVKPKLVLMGDMSMDYPMNGASYTFTAGASARKFHQPIPPDYTLWIGCHGEANPRGLKVQTTASGVASGPEQFVATTSITTDERFSLSIPASGGINGVDISLDTTEAGTLVLGGLIMQLIPTGLMPAFGGFMSGRGNSGCLFEDKPNRIVYSLNGETESVSLTAKLVEVGDWL
jgi:hypothetical protein